MMIHLLFRYSTDQEPSTRSGKFCFTRCFVRSPDREIGMERVRAMGTHLFNTHALVFYSY